MRLYILLDEALREASWVLGWVLSSSTGLLHAFAVTSQRNLSEGSSVLADPWQWFYIVSFWSSNEEHFFL